MRSGNSGLVLAGNAQHEVDGPARRAGAWISGQRTTIGDTVGGMRIRSKKAAFDEDFQEPVPAQPRSVPVGRTL